jgi:hypothetical protein
LENVPHTWALPLAKHKAKSIMNVPHPWALPMVKHKAKSIMNQTYEDYDAEEGYYVYL